jgi:ferrous iron transport protein B
VTAPAKPTPAAPFVEGAKEHHRVVVVGNPNVGKTTLFNRLTGERARVGNYPGVTVELRSGLLRDHARPGEDLELVDLPGTYSLSARSEEEQIAIREVLGLGVRPPPRLAVVVVDAGQLIRNLYLVLQLVELEVPLVIALNMIDEVAERAPRPEAIARVFGVPCVATSARSGKGIDELCAAIRAAADDPPRGNVRIEYPTDQRGDVDAVAEALDTSWRTSVERDRALARWALLSIDEDDELRGIPADLRTRCRAARERVVARDLDVEIIGARYGFLDGHAASFYEMGEAPTPKASLTDRVDGVLIHPLYGFAIFIAIMLVIFQSLFTWADPAISFIEFLVAEAQGLAGAWLPEGLIRDLLIEGVLGGVGNVIVFLPQILLLFLFVGLLEDSGYMARVAYLMDRVMRSLGLHGRAFVPMLSGFACAIPAILATRTMERQRDRLLTMLVIPLMTCSARLPVYSLIIAALFPPTEAFGSVPVQGLLMMAMYLFATFVALGAAAVLGRTVVRGRGVPLILELPPYRLPKFTTTLRMMWEKARVFLTEAGTVILVCTVILWGLLSFPKLPAEAYPDQSEDVRSATQIQQSYAGRFGHAIEPAIRPLGFDWKIGVGLVGAFAAREVFVSTMGIVYGVGGDDEDIAPLRDRMRAETRGDGTPAYAPLAGLSLMVFFALACQCMSTLAVVRRETRSWRWPAFLFVYMTTLAWLASFAVYQGGKLLGF